jgi:hypothetical protein
MESDGCREKKHIYYDQLLKYRIRCPLPNQLLLLKKLILFEMKIMYVLYMTYSITRFLLHFY